MKKISIRFGILIGVILIGYFLILAFFGWHTKPAFSLFNGVITGLGIYETIKAYKQYKGDDFTYSSGFSTGILTGFIATLIFTIFFLIYATEINSEFLSQLLTIFRGSYNVSVGLVTFVVAIMGFATTVVLTLTFMQLFVGKTNISQNV
jgi:hypothetical protein